MKAITIWQPWAQLLIEGVKMFETRSWPAPSKLIGERMAIHAAARKQDVDAVAMAFPAIGRALERAGYEQPFDGLLVYGAVLGTARLSGVYQMTEKGAEAFYNREINGIQSIHKNQEGLGDYDMGRFLWRFDEHELFDKPIPAKGMQRIWNWG